MEAKLVDSEIIHLGNVLYSELTQACNPVHGGSPPRYHSVCNSLTTVGYLLGVFFRLWIPFLVVFPLLLGASTGNLS